MKRFGILVGAVLAAIAASACCILPLLLGAASAGTVGLSAALTPYRPYLMGLTFVMLGIAFYFTYRPIRVKGGAACCSPAPVARSQRIHRAILWLVTVFALGAMAYPWIGEYRAHRASGPPAAVPVTAQTTVFAIPSMDCPACAANIAHTLQKTPGVYKAKVDYDTKRATVRYDARRTGVAQLRDAIDRTGFPATQITASRTPAAPSEGGREKP